MKVIVLRKHICLSGMLLFILNTTYSQNLIHNGSFEYIDTSYNTTTQFEIVYPWLGQSVDLYSISDVGVKLNQFPYFCKPIDGNNICGLIMYYRRDREALVGELIKPLIRDHKYKLSFYYIPQKKGYNRKFTIDYCFAEKMNPRGNSPYSVNKLLTCFDFTPERTRKWHLFESVFTPNGNEKYIIVWHPKNNDMKDYFYYYFDNFMLIDLDSIVVDLKVQVDSNKSIKHSIITLNSNILFGFDDYKLMRSAEDSIVSILKSNNYFQNCIVEIFGYTDSIGTDEYNKYLSKARAESVYNFILKNVFTAKNISFKGMGAMDPIADNSSEHGRQSNRRVEIHLTCQIRE